MSISYLKKYFAFTCLTACLMLVSCETDPCKDVVCQNNGTAVATGDLCNCNCSTGYEGEFCETLARAKFIGQKNGNETCDTGTSIYALEISADGSDDLGVVFDNLYDAGILVNGESNSDGDITIASQSFGTGQISGGATIDANGVITVTYTVSSGGLSDNCVWISQ